MSFVINMVVFGAIVIAVAAAGVLACMDLNRDYVKHFRHGESVRPKNKLAK